MSDVKIQNEVRPEDSTVSIPSIIYNDRYSSLMFSYSIGTQRVMFNRLLVRFALKSGFVFGGLKETRIGIADEYTEVFGEIAGLVGLDFGTRTTSSNFVKRVTKNSLLNQNIISVTIGIGFLVY